jgi:hypothetical protein
VSIRSPFPEQTVESESPPPLAVKKGTCYALFAYDVGLWIDLEEADRHITATKERSKVRHKRRAPDYFEFQSPPLRVIQEGTPFQIGGYGSSKSVEATLYDFGAISIAYRFPIEGPFSSLLNLSEALYDNALLLGDSRKLVGRLLQVMKKAVGRPHMAPFTEDYVIFQIESHSALDPMGIPHSHSHQLAQILRCEPEPLSGQEISDATAIQISYSPEDAAVIDWNASLLIGTEMDDTLAVLEFANVELLEMRLLDQQLDDALDQAYDAISKKTWRRLRFPGSVHTDVSRIAQLQVDNALIFERVANTLKLLGDQYLARIYRAASQRFHLTSWDTSIMRKLQTLESIYEKMTDRAATRRMEVLEWIIIILIAVSIIVGFLPEVSIVEAIKSLWTG